MTVIARITPGDQEWLRESSAILRGKKDASPAVRRVAAQELDRIAHKAQTSKAEAMTAFERDTLQGFVTSIMNAGLDTYGLSGAEKAALVRAVKKL